MSRKSKRELALVIAFCGLTLLVVLIGLSIYTLFSASEQGAYPLPESAPAAASAPARAN